MEIETGKLMLKQTDSSGFPKLKTKNYLTTPIKEKEIKYSIQNYGLFGKLEPGLIGSHSIDLNFMDYGGGIDIPYFTEFRTAKDDKGDSLSQVYFFEKDETPLSIFLLVKRPWIQIITGEKEKYLVKGYLRSPKREILQKARTDLENIFKSFKI